MRSSLLALLVTLVVVPAASAASPTANFNFRHGETNFQTAPATVPGAYQGGERPSGCVNGVPTCTYEAHDFLIAPGEENGRFHVTITWESSDDDWDLYVYRVRDDDTVDENAPVASSAQGGTTEETATLHSPDVPIKPGKYRIFVDNWASAIPDWEGFVSFEPFVATNKLPIVAFNAPATAAAGQPVTLDAAGSTDPDGTIVSYAWDLDGDGRFEIDGGGEPRHTATFPSGRAQVGVRVRDDRGGATYANRTIDVGPAPPGAPQVPPTTDEFILPPPVGRIALDAPRRQRMGEVRRRGFRATVECPSACRINASLRISGPTASSLGLGDRARTIARRRRSLSTRGFPRLRLKPSRAVRGALALRRSVPATLIVAVTAQGFDPKTYRVPVRIVR